MYCCKCQNELSRCTCPDMKERLAQISSIKYLCIDIETGPASPEALAQVMPEFKAPANYKNPAKIDAYLNEAESAWVEKAALSAITGQILVIGLYHDNSIVEILQSDERTMLEAFWRVWGKGGLMVGFACKTFDFPFIFQRSLINNVPVPEDLWVGRYLNLRVIDLQERWCCFSNRIEGQSLNAVCQALGLGKKNGNGADFAGLFKADRKAALEYVIQDLTLTMALAKRLGVAYLCP